MATPDLLLPRGAALTPLLPDLLRIEQQGFPEPWSEALLREEADHPERALLVLRRGEQVLAFVWARPSTPW